MLIKESILLSKENKEKGMIIKLDMANTFDSVRHSYLFDVMNKFGLCTFFIKCVSSYKISPWIASLVNGQPYSMKSKAWDKNAFVSNIVHYHGKLLEWEIGGRKKSEESP